MLPQVSLVGNGVSLIFGAHLPTNPLARSVPLSLTMAGARGSLRPYRKEKRFDAATTLEYDTKEQNRQAKIVVGKITKTLNRVLRGDADANVRFDDLVALLIHLGFVERVRGSHHILTHDGVVEILNLQPRDGKAKPYQVKQVRDVIVAYGLAGASSSGGPAEDEADSVETDEDDG